MRLIGLATKSFTAMAALACYFKYLKGEFATQDLVPYARQSLKE